MPKARPPLNLLKRESDFIFHECPEHDWFEGLVSSDVEMYVKRLEELEGVANSFEGVDKSYAIQAGREVRIMVKPEKLDDLGAAKLAHDVAQKIHDTLIYPGQVKVTVVRETRNVQIAK